MRRFVEGADREQSTLFPECLEDWIGEDNPVRVIDVFVDELDLAELGFSGVDPEATGRPSYHPSVLLKSGGALRRAISLDRPSMRASSRRQSPARSSITRTIRGDRTSGGTARMRGSSARKNRCPCRTAMPRSSRKARIFKITGDRYAGEWPREQFRKLGIAYEPAAKPKSDLYRDLLPIINSRRVDLLDHSRLVNQLVSLERRTARGGRDFIDHAPGAHDDIANAVAGCVAGSECEQRIRVPRLGVRPRRSGTRDDNDGRQRLGPSFDTTLSLAMMKERQANGRNRGRDEQARPDPRGLRASGR